MRSKSNPKTYRTKAMEFALVAAERKKDGVRRINTSAALRIGFPWDDAIVS